VKLHIKILPSILLLCFSATAQKQLLVAVQQRPDSVAIVDLNKHVIIAQLPTGLMPHELCYDKISKRCFITNFGVEDYDNRIGTPGNSITIINPFAHKIIETIYTRPDSVANCPHGIKIRPGKARELFVNVEIGDSMIVYDLATLVIKRKFSVPKGTHNFIFSPAGDRLWLFTGIDGVFEINPDNGKVIQHKIFSSPIRGLTFIKDNILASGKNELFILSKKDLSIVKQIKNLQVGQILYSAVTNDNRYIIAPVALDNIVLIIDAINGKILKRLQTGQTPINVKVTKNFAYVSHALDDHITRIDLHSFKTYNDIKVRGANGIIIIN
jgi:DNA-binding beta-propeller fold protein YncE